MRKKRALLRVKEPLGDAPPVDWAKVFQIHADRLLGKSKNGIIASMGDVKRSMIAQSRLAAPAALKLRVACLLAKDCVEQQSGGKRKQPAPGISKCAHASLTLLIQMRDQFLRTRRNLMDVCGKQFDQSEFLNKKTDYVRSTVLVFHFPLR